MARNFPNRKNTKVTKIYIALKATEQRSLEKNSRIPVNFISFCS